MEKLNIWTIDEYYEKMKEFFSNQEDKVIKIICPGVLGGSYHYWIKPSLMSTDKFIDIYWKFEPLMKRYFSSKDEMASNLNPDIKNNAVGFILRWLFGNMDREIIYQPIAVHGDINDFVDDYRKTKSTEYLMGFKMDPFVYIAKLPIKKGSGGEEYIDDKSLDFKPDSNYRVFWEEITPEQFLKEESLFTDEKTHDSYNDDLLDSGYVMKKEIENFFKKHTDFRY